MMGASILAAGCSATPQYELGDCLSIRKVSAVQDEVEKVDCDSERAGYKLRSAALCEGSQPGDEPSRRELTLGGKSFCAVYIK